MSDGEKNCSPFCLLMMLIISYDLYPPSVILQELFNLLANWQSLWKRIEKGAGEACRREVDKKASGYKDSLLLSDACYHFPDWKSETAGIMFMGRNRERN